jgi:hypothetical protein
VVRKLSKRRNLIADVNRKDVIKIDLRFNICMNIFRWS